MNYIPSEPKQAYIYIYICVYVVIQSYIYVCGH